MQDARLDDHNLESRLLGEIQQFQQKSSKSSNLRYAMVTAEISNSRKWRGTKEPLDDSERGEVKSWLKTQHSKN